MLENNNIASNSNINGLINMYSAIGNNTNNNNTSSNFNHSIGRSRYKSHEEEQKSIEELLYLEWQKLIRQKIIQQIRINDEKSKPAIVYNNNHSNNNNNNSNSSSNININMNTKHSRSNTEDSNCPSLKKIKNTTSADSADAVSNDNNVNDMSNDNNRITSNMNQCYNSNNIYSYNNIDNNSNNNVSTNLINHNDRIEMQHRFKQLTEDDSEAAKSLLSLFNELNSKYAVSIATNNNSNNNNKSSAINNINNNIVSNENNNTADDTQGNDTIEKIIVK